MAEKLPGGHETILLVDDQETVWDFLIEALQNLGYSVILAENGLDAVEICLGESGADRPCPAGYDHAENGWAQHFLPDPGNWTRTSKSCSQAAMSHRMPSMTCLQTVRRVFFRNRTGSKHSPMNCAAFWTRRLRKKHPLRFEKLPFPGSYHTAVSCFIIKNS